MGPFETPGRRCFLFRFCSAGSLRGVRASKAKRRSSRFLKEQKSLVLQKSSGVDVCDVFSMFFSSVLCTLEVFSGLFT